jgi:hypothetical protein
VWVVMRHPHPAESGHQETFVRLIAATSGRSMHHFERMFNTHFLWRQQQSISAAIAQPALVGVIRIALCCTFGLCKKQ